MDLELQSIQQLMVGKKVVDVKESTDRRGVEWLVIHMDDGSQVHIKDSGKVLVDPQVV